MNEPEVLSQALSVRQPWAWLIVKGHKPVENRSWWTSFRGRFWVHASKSMSKIEYEVCRNFVLKEFGLMVPAASMLPRGGIVGWATLEACVKEHESKWFAGPYGFVLARPGECNFRACKGKLGFFRPDQ